MNARMGLMVAALWWGSLTALGFVVVPMLFSYLGSPAAAGAMAARLFTAQTWLSIVCTMLLLIIFNPNKAVVQVSSASSTIKLIVAGLLLTVLVEFGVSPRIVSARATGADLRVWHGVGSAMYFGQWLCAGLTLWFLTAREPATPLQAEATDVKQ